MLLSEGQMSDYKDAALMLDALPRAKAMLGDKGYDADWFRNALIKRGIVPAFPQKPTARYQSPTIRRFIASAIKSKTCSANSRTGGVSTPGYDRCAHTFFSAICIAATIIFWINQ
jgi:hypothetical protein